MAVDVRAIRGGWGGLRPVLSLEGLRIADRQGKAVFELRRADVSVSWWSLFGGQLRFDDVELEGPHLELRRGPDGLIYLADKPLNASGGGGDGTFTEWLLSQRHLGIHDATLVWRDDFLGLPEVSLTQVEIAVERRRGHHHAALTARPSRDVGSSVDLRADVQLTRRDGRWLATGEAYGEARDAVLETLGRHLPIAEALRSGRASVRAWGTFSPEGVQEVTADLNVRDARARLAADLLPLEFASLSGRAAYKAQADGFTFATESLRFRLASGLEAEPGRFLLARTQSQGSPRLELRADNIDLKIAAALSEYFPLPRDVKGQVQRFAPRGRIRDAQLAWREQPPHAYDVRGRFEDLSVNAVDALPGLDGFDGTIEGSERGGTLTLDTRKARLGLSRLFPAPLAFEELQMVARWKPVGEALEVAIDSAHFVNADGEGTVAGTWRSLPGTEHPMPGAIDLKGSFTRADLTRIAGYLPERFAITRDWLQRSVLAGESRRASFELRGDLYQFPFGPGVDGRFLFEGDIAGGKLRYHPDWPSIDAINGSMRFENRRMEIRADRAAIFTSRLAKVSAVVEDFAVKPVLVAVQGDVDTSGAEVTRFLRESPLATGPGAFTRAVAIEGPAHLKLRLDLPLGALETMKVAGEYAFTGSSASTPRGVSMRDLHGVVAFNERSVRASDVAGSLFDKPATLALATQPDGSLLTTIEGHIDRPALDDWVPQAFATKLSGGLDFKARVTSARGATDLVLESDLRGLAAALPEPLAKKAGDARALEISIANLGTERELTRGTLEGGIHGRFHRVGPVEAPRWEVAVRFGAPPVADPAREGLWLYGDLAAADVDAWQAMFPATPPATDAVATDGAAFELRGLDLHLGRVRYLSREFLDLTARLERQAGRWSGHLESPLVAGDVSWDPRGRGRLVAKLERLAVPQSTPAANAPPNASAGADAELPAIDISADRFQFRGRELGHLDLKAEPGEHEWRIDRLDLAAPFGTMASTGVWRPTGTGSITTLELKLDVRDMSRLFAVFGHGDDLKRGTGTVEASLAWPGLPHEFDVGVLAGSMHVDARNGQFAKMDPGAGKLLGLLSLQSLPRRASLDFRDVFSDGFAFEKIQGNVKVARGILLADAFEISGPAAFVSLSGEVSLPQETQALTLRVVPEVGEGVALAASLIGTPVLGLSTLLVSKLLKNPLGKVVAYEYQVTGSWDNPVVSRTSAAGTARAAPAPQASATPTP